MNVGMSLACLYPMEPENVIPCAREIGVNVCEIFLNTVSELEEPYLQMLRDECDRHGLKVHSIHPFTSSMENYIFFSPYPRRIEDAMAFYRRYATAAKILGAGVVNIHGDRGLGIADFDSYVECLGPLRHLQNETGICFSLENVYYNSVNHPEFTVRLRQRVGDVRFTFDIKQAAKGSQDPYAVAEAMGEAVVNFHVNDYDGDHICLLPGCGVVDHKRIFDILAANHYVGPALIEVYRKNFSRLQEVLDSKKYLEAKFMLAK